MGVIQLYEVSSAIRQRKELDEWIQGLPISEFLVSRFIRLHVTVRSHVCRAVRRMRSHGVCHVDTDLLGRYDAELIASKPSRKQLHMLLAVQMREEQGRPRYHSFKQLDALWPSLSRGILGLFERDDDPRVRERSVRFTKDTMDFAALILMHLMSQPASVRRSRPTTGAKPL